jgi:chromate transporter
MRMEGHVLESHATAAPPAVPYTLRSLVTYFLSLGTWGFGGPVALVGYMHRDLVERRRWITDADYREGLSLAQLAPGPLAAQLAIYIGYVHNHILGATLVGLAFVLPSFVMVVALGWLYTLYGGLNWMQAVFYGVGPAVIGIIAISSYKLTRKSIGKDWLLWAVYLVSAVCTVVTETEIVWLFFGAGLIVWLLRAPPHFQRPTNAAALVLPLSTVGGLTMASSDTLWQIALFFAKAGAFVFGSGLAIVPFLYGGVVKEYHWLSDQQFLDAVAVAMITPGPVVITVGFFGFLVAGLAGATVAALATFLPCYLITVGLAPHFKKCGKRPGVVAFVDGVTVAAIGAIVGAVIVLGRRTLLEHGQTPDFFKIVLMLIAVGVLVRFRKLPEPFIVLAAAIAGLIVYPLVH